MRPAGEQQAGVSTISVYQLTNTNYLCVFVPGVEQRGACAGRTNQVNSQVSSPVVGQGEPGLDML